ncbi:exocyst complex subunit 5 [Tieghemostelium lacteum]|uniref:Exocyst complex subunit 5 n=1 Tax=Tieghemostelium lacteum TaxID=361077 RepID=A0A151ZHL0_TIELA|nr:exocyst complex subunit 5 [Tieghemostelium lacteum]|eukprot:KYQ93399.1 exocyst complex subunit 5 [Tieghemostelium lacteum]
MSWTREIGKQKQNQIQFQSFKPQPKEIPGASSKPVPLGGSNSNVSPPSPQSTTTGSSTPTSSSPTTPIKSQQSTVVSSITSVTSGIGVGGSGNSPSSTSPKIPLNNINNNLTSTTTTTPLKTSSNITPPQPTSTSPTLQSASVPTITTTPPVSNKVSPTLQSQLNSNTSNSSTTAYKPPSSQGGGLLSTASASTLASANKPQQFTRPAYQSTKIVQRVLTDDIFRGTEFSPVNFVEDLTRKLVNDQNASDGLHFDPEPFNKLFINTRLELTNLESQIDNRLDNLVRECNEYDRDYKFKLSNLIDSYQECFQHFKLLEKGVNTIGTKAVHFGDELDSVNQQKSKAQSALSLINYLLELNDSSVVKRSDIFTNPERLHELAGLVKKLSSVSEDIKDIGKFKQGKLETEAISNTLENNLLNQFDRAAERKDFEKMRECAVTLYNFNGGDSCRARYVSKLKMFFDENSLNRDESLATNTGRRVIRSNQIVEDPRFELFFTEILKDVAQEHDTIQRVFINQTSAMEMLFVRIFEQRVHMFLENALSVEKPNSLQYLQTVHFAITSTKKQLVEPLTSYGIVGVDFNLLMASLFFSYQETYIAKELGALHDIFSLQLREEIDRLQDMENHGEFDDSGLNPEITQSIVQNIENALTRCYALSLQNLQAENIKSIFFLLLKYLFSEYITYTLERAMDILPSTDPKCFQSLIQLFSLILSINQIVGQIQTLYQLFVLPYIQTNINIQSQCSDQLSFSISNLEIKICEALEKSLVVITQLVDKSLLEQKKNDYQTEDYDNSVTKTCQQVVKLIQSFYDLSKNSLQGKNFYIFIEELGLKLQVLFINHYKKFKVGQGIGALKLLRDLTEYKETMKKFKSHKVDDGFELLFEISKLHFIVPENFKAIIESGCLSRMPKNDLIIFIKQRSDFQSLWLDYL